MRRPALFLTLAAAAMLSACSSLNPTRSLGTGPGASCDTCATTEVAPALPPGTSGTLEAASARNGQDASSQPVQTDPARIAPTTTLNRGSGPNVNAGVAQENRSQAGAPAVNQGLVFPASAMTSTDSPARAVVDSIQLTLRQLLEEHKAATDPSAKAQLWAAINTTMDRLAQATATAGHGGDTYNLQGARIVQVVANGSKSGDAPGTAIDPENAKNIGAAAGDMVRNVLTGEGPAPAPEPSTPAPAEGGGR